MLPAANPHLRSPLACSECDGSGFVLSEETDDAVPCRCRPGRVAAARTRSLSRTIPERFAHVGFDRYPVTEMEQVTVREVRRFCDRMDERLAEGKGLFFFGTTGTGKTTLAMLVAQEAMRRAKSVSIYDAPQLMRRIHAIYKDPSHTVHQLMDEFEAVDLLVLDDVAVARQTDWVTEQLYSVINARYQAGRSLVITADVESPEQLRDHIGQRSYSRVIESCRPIAMFGSDQRLLHSET